jgi:hypothetical protein
MMALTNADMPGGCVEADVGVVLLGAADFGGAVGEVVRGALDAAGS